MPTLPRLPLIPDPLRRIRVPRDLPSVTTIGAEADPETVGLSPRTINRIWAAGRNLYKTGVHPAVQLCLRRHSEVALDRAIGHASGNGPSDTPDAPKVLATPDTPFCVFSTSKAMTAMVVHLLHERGALSIFDRVTDYIPEYGRHGKGDTTIAHVLSHRAGVPTLPRRMLDLDTIENREQLTESICDAKPFHKPGTLLAYHAVSGGFILGEIVQRVTGKSIRAVLGESILDPLGFRWGNYGVAPEDVAEVGLNYATGPKLIPPLSNLVSRVLSRPVDELVEISNDPRFLTAVIPAGNLITTANELSRFFEIFRAGGELDGVRVMAAAHDPPGDRGAVPARDRPLARLPDPVQLRADARRQGAEPVRARHGPGLWSPRVHQHHRLGGPGAGALGRPDHQREGDHLSRAAPVHRPDAADRVGGAEGASERAPDLADH